MLNFENPLMQNALLPPCRGKAGMGVALWSDSVSTPTLALPPQGGGDVAVVGRVLTRHVCDKHVGLKPDLHFGFVHLIFTATLLSLFHLNAYAAPGAVEVLSIAEREVVTLKNGKQVVLRAPVDKAVPGDEIIYTTTFKNPGAKPAAHIVITNPVPNDSLYKSGSAIGANTLITFSVDGGNQYAASNKLFIKTKEGKTRPALPAEYTHIRWTYKGDLGVGKAGEVSFRASIK